MTVLAAKQVRARSARLRAYLRRWERGGFTPDVVSALAGELRIVARHLVPESAAAHHA
jgi:hypothetical protein